MSLIKTKSVEFGGQTLLLRLDAKTMVQVENKLGKSLLALFVTNGGMTFPKVGELLLVLQSANTSHSVKESDMYELYDNYLQDGNSFMDLFELVQKLIEEAGFFPQSKDDSLEDDQPTLIEEAEVIDIKAENSLV